MNNIIIIIIVAAILVVIGFLWHKIWNSKAKEDVQFMTEEEFKAKYPTVYKTIESQLRKRDKNEI